MSNKKQNEELQSRREFFKKAAKAALPVVGAVVLSNLPLLKAEAAPMGCNYAGCTGTCYGGCQGGCGQLVCQGGCKGTCSGGCTGSCYGGCQQYCTGLAYYG